MFSENKILLFMPFARWYSPVIPLIKCNIYEYVSIIQDPSHKSVTWSVPADGAGPSIFILKT